MSLEINSPSVIAEVQPLFEAYERALLANDVVALGEFFWASGAAVRYGAREQLYGAEEIAAFRRNRVINFSGRRPLRVTYQAFGDNVVCVLLEYEAQQEGETRRGRQTQTWVRFPEQGWRIANAHVSLLPREKGEELEILRATLAAQGFRFTPGDLTGAYVQWARAAELAEPLLALALPDPLEPAGIFRP